MLLSDADWSRYFGEPLFGSSAWRFETQQTYTMPKEQGGFALWRAGSPRPADYNKSWTDRIASFTASGRSVGRVRVHATEQLTDYQRFLFEWATEVNVAAGEDVRILDLWRHPEAQLNLDDWWLFDESTVVRLIFNPDGTIHHRELVDDPDIPAYLAVRDQVTSLSVPYSAYATDRP